ncbi:putative bifunctional diguanylate cyclase/phosphodiesterase [Solimonas soli]|uniref:putative bifunctional diguanylate cyclase/phosphodiesterase n=1 Tax=Solimonas soli TaxID=413479 RepID=UPI0004884A49|nr:GGDEF domain-containing phosphodiesterase [Solimonas soli]
MDKFLQDAVRGAQAGAWEYLRADDQATHTPWRFRPSSELKALIGFADAELDEAPEPWMTRVHAEDLATFRRALGHCFHGLSERLDVIFRVLHRDGGWRTVRASGAVERDDDGRARRLCGLTWDVSHYVAAHRRAGMITRAFDSAVGGLAICDSAFKVLEANRAMHQVAGWPDGEICNRPLDDVMFGATGQTLPEAAAAAVQRKGLWIGRVEAVRRDRNTYPAEIRLSAIRGDDGAISHYVALVFDLQTMRPPPAEAAAARAPAQHGSGQLLPILELAIKEAVGMRTGLVVLLLGIDSLTSMIEAYGRQRVDAILDACADRLREALDDIVVASRSERDRFVVVIADVMEERVIEQAFARLLHALAGVTVDGRPYHLTASAGAAVFPLDGSRGEVLLQRAEGALEEAQRRGRSAGRLELYRPQFSDHASDRVHLESNLRRAMKTGAFECHLQPKVRLEDGRWVGAEALMRWRIGDTWIAPSRFIPIAEQSGLIKDIGRWVLWEAAAHIASWRRDALIGEDFRVAVNLAGAQLDHELMRTVRAVLSYNQLPSEALMLELTETIIVNDPERARKLLEELRRIGVRISVDDFGTGYTSMSQLQTLPVDELKIDRSFVRGLPGDDASCAIVRSVATLAQGLKLDAVAEGVETETQRAALLKLGYRYGQGFLFAKAMPPLDFERELRAQRQSRSDGAPSRGRRG